LWWWRRLDALTLLALTTLGLAGVLQRARRAAARG
jgi:hypothetical protein